MRRMEEKAGKVKVYLRVEERTEDRGEENEGNKHINKCEGNNTTNNFL